LLVSCLSKHGADDNVTAKSKYLARDQKPYVGKIINNILPEAEMDSFHTNMVKIN
jgi:hypothetical protein